jgi:hypothetical protein
MPVTDVGFQKIKNITGNHPENIKSDNFFA